MNKRVTGLFLAGAMIFSVVPAAVAAETVSVDPSTVTVLGNWVMSQVHAIWDQLYNQHPQVAVSLLLAVASALVYRSNTDAGMKMRNVVKAVREAARRKLFSDDRGAQGKATAKQKGESKKTAAAAAR